MFYASCMEKLRHREGVVCLFVLSFVEGHTQLVQPGSKFKDIWIPSIFFLLGYSGPVWGLEVLGATLSTYYVPYGCELL